jgi:hypothetical protein
LGNSIILFPTLGSIYYLFYILKAQQNECYFFTLGLLPPAIVCAFRAFDNNCLTPSALLILSRGMSPLCFNIIAFEDKDRNPTINERRILSDARGRAFGLDLTIDLQNALTAASDLARVMENLIQRESRKIFGCSLNMVAKINCVFMGGRRLAGRSPYTIF